MNDEFLHRLRKPPPPRFAAALKARLDALDGTPRPAGTWLRTLLLMFVAGGAAVATTLIVLRGAPTVMTQMFDSQQGVSPTIAAPDVTPRTGERPRRMVPFSRDSRGGIATGPTSEVEMQSTLARLAPRVTGPAASAPSSPEQGAAAAPVVVLPAAAFVPLTIASSRTTYRVAKSTAELAQRVLGRAVGVGDESDGLLALCGSGARPQMAVVSERMAGRAELCLGNGVERIVEMRIGWQAIVVSASRAAATSQLTRHELYLALARRVPDPRTPNQLINNPYRTWNQINPKLGNTRIEIFGPHFDSALIEPIEELLLEPECNADPWLAELRGTDVRLYERFCHGIRDDGAYVEIKQDDLLPHTLAQSPAAVALLSYSYYESRQASLGGSVLEGPDPTLQSIESGTYLGSRPLYIYINREAAMRVEGFGLFLGRYLGETGIGSEGPLVRDAGLLPLNDNERLNLQAGALQQADMRL